MAKLPVIKFHPLTVPNHGSVALFVGKSLVLGSIARGLDEASSGAVNRAIKAADFKGELAKSITILAPAGLDLDQIVVVGVGEETLSECDFLRLGGTVMGQHKGVNKASIIAEIDGVDINAASVSLVAMGMKLRAYDFDKYKTEKGKPKKQKSALAATVLCADHEGAAKAWETDSVVSDGTLLARDLVNEPANVLGPKEFAAKAKALEAVGAKVEIFKQTELEKLGMRALLGVAQGSERPPRVAIIKWNGGKKDDAPVVFVGKGVVFDTGGISIKPAGGMEDMKGDMGGAATVTGLMHALSARKAKVNAIGIIGLVENMPDGNAMRPGDIVKSMSGQTIEVINTDAEGRLVLCDLLHYAKETFKPRFMVDLATLTGAVLVALGTQNAGIFSNNDALCDQLSDAGEVTGETVWRLPLAKEYDKLIDSKFADMKNTGGRWAGSITAAQFLKRFVGDVDWVHIDVAGTAMDSPKTATSQGWASGYGVRLLDRMVKDNYEV
ncbi:leucyl aminopeptidase [Cohaesibacter celericrescens]|uniref:Probable cytosol aminopeptidase n=1 Tax=Cohaesibacter celericrescens TaxID=2067669 RepID=A0A2N5XSB4_9HYPH|nr:leucyl aminopeptidase [Cohaesibacter celericrescens]PLW77403.1 leucyl aminopeptidase [Cohaesibacter celericrescens]